MKTDFFFQVYDNVKDYQKSDLSHSLHPHKYHHWTNVYDMIKSGLIELLIDKLNHPHHSKYINFNQVEANLVCERVNNITQFKRIFNLKKEVFNQLLTESNSNRELMLNTIKGGNLEIVIMLIPESIALDTILEYIKEAFILGYIDIFEYLIQEYNKKYGELDIFKWLDVFQSRSISGYYWVNLWLSDNSSDHKRIRDLFKIEADENENENNQSYLEKAIVKLGKPYWYNFLPLGDPSLYFSCKDEFKVVENQGANWGSNYFKKEVLLNPSFSNRLRMELMLTVYLYERYHNDEKTIESALLEIVNSIRDRHPDCQIDDHATGFEEHVFLLLVLSSSLGTHFQYMKSKLVSAEYKLTTLVTLYKVNNFLNKIYGFSDDDLLMQLITEYPALNKPQLPLFPNHSALLLSNSLAAPKLFNIFCSVINGEVLYNNTEEVLLYLLNRIASRINRHDPLHLHLQCKSPGSLRFVLKNHDYIVHTCINIEISDDSLHHLLHPMFDNILVDFNHNILFKLFFIKSISYTDSIIDVRVTSLISALNMKPSMKIFNDYENPSYVSIKQFLHFPKLLDYFINAAKSNIDYGLVGSMASYEIYKKLKDAVAKKRIILVYDWEKQVYESAMKYVEFSQPHKDFIKMMDFDPTKEIFDEM